MPVILDNKKFYKTQEACRLAGTNRDTLLRWIRENKFTDVKLRDRNGWRLFTDDDLTRLKKKVNRITDTGIIWRK
jgi:excisionase family DNA binding protein